jgi:hypothetical protein
MVKKEDFIETGEHINIIVKAAEKFKTITELEKKFPNNYDFGRFVREEINKQKYKKR